MSANDFKIKFQNFVRTFKEAEAEEDEMVENFSTNDPLYMQKLHEVGCNPLKVRIESCGCIFKLSFVT